MVIATLWTLRYDAIQSSATERAVQIYIKPAFPSQIFLFIKTPPINRLFQLLWSSASHSLVSQFAWLLSAAELSASTGLFFNPFYEYSFFSTVIQYRNTILPFRDCMSLILRS